MMQESIILICKIVRLNKGNVISVVAIILSQAPRLHYCTTILLLRYLREKIVLDCRIKLFRAPSCMQSALTATSVQRLVLITLASCMLFALAFNQHNLYHLRKRNSSAMSAVTTLVCENPADFDNCLGRAVSRNSQHLFILFFASVNPSTGVSWCPDCVRAKPLIDAALAKQTEETTFLVCNVDREPYKTNREYPYRVDPRIELKCVPTLIKWRDDKKVLQLNDVQCQNIDLVEEIIRSD